MFPATSWCCKGAGAGSRSGSFGSGHGRVNLPEKGTARRPFALENMFDVFFVRFKGNLSLLNICVHFFQGT